MTAMRVSALCSLILFCACNRSEASAESAPTAEASATTSASEPPPAGKEEWQACPGNIERAKSEPALAGAPAYEKERVHMARVRGAALLWRRTPKPSATLDELRPYTDDPVKLVAELNERIRKLKSPEARRSHLLREGYVFHEDVQIALALVEQLGLTQLYREKRLFLERGAQILELEYAPKSRFEDERYLYKEGIYAGMRAEILFGDRVGTSRDELEKSPSMVVDLGDLAERSTFDRLRPVHLSEGHLVADLRYGAGTWVPALFTLKGPKVELLCEALDGALAEKKKSHERSSAVLRSAMRVVRGVVRDMVREEIPFDADSDQSNGFLRKAWKRSYFKGWKKFHFEDELRTVYTEDGRARPPQVCIDFLTDVWERSSGTWYAGMEGDPLKPKPERTKGGIDFDKLGITNRRSVAEFTKFTLEHKDLFDVWALPKDERIEFNERRKFFDYLAKQADMFVPGDMITIHGYKEGGRPHYHSLIILEKDPVTGVPTLVGGNAVFAREQTLEGVMHISPQRTLRHRIRVREPWLKLVAARAQGS
jgi:hypothetical protein